jgi:hypothetical protein
MIPNLKLITKTTRSFENWVVAQKGSDAQQLISFGKQMGWEVDVLGVAPMPTESFKKGDWLIVPAHMDKSILPARARKRVQALRNAGLHPIGYVLVHEIPKTYPIDIHKISEKNISNGKSALKAISGVIGTVALVTGALTLFVIAAGVLIPGALITTALLIDPILVAVSTDNQWVEIDRWWD